MTATPSNLHRLALRGVSFTYPRAATPTFESIDLALERGWTGLVGANGAGKTTLLRLLSGDLAPDAGVIRREPHDARVAWLVQVLDHPDAVLQAFAARSDRDATRLRAELDLVPDELARWATLSPGERRRWQLAAAIDAAPDILLLDEPEGHLDHAARQRLVQALRRFRGIGVLVAHDRALLDAVTQATVEVEAGTLRHFPGAWSAARAAWDGEREARIAERAELRGARDRARASLDAARRDAAAADRQKSTGARMKDRHDSDARGIMGRNQAEWGARAHDRRALRQTRTLEQHTRALEDSALARRLEARAFAFVYEPPPQRVLAGGHWEELIAGEGHVVARDVNLWLERGARVHLRGPNGAGKTTLVGAMLARANVPGDRLLHLPQELSREATRSTLDAVRTAPPELRGRVLSLVAALGASPERLIATDAPSPGEARKLQLALGLARGVAALILDEPTNHLDLPAIERLQAALLAWPGALLLVSHDDALAAAVTTTTWTVGDGVVVVASRDA